MISRYTRWAVLGLLGFALISPQTLRADATLAGRLQVEGILGTVLYGFIGILMAMISYKVLDWITPWSLDKELAEDQNVSVGLVVGGMFIGVSLIIAAAIL